MACFLSGIVDLGKAPWAWHVENVIKIQKLLGSRVWSTITDMLGGLVHTFIPTAVSRVDNPISSRLVYMRGQEIQSVAFLAYEVAPSQLPKVVTAAWMKEAIIGIVNYTESSIGCQLYLNVQAWKRLAWAVHGGIWPKVTTFRISSPIRMSDRPSTP